MLGQILDDRYHVLEKIGEGGMGEIYLAEHIHLGRREALKILHPVLAAQAEFVARFRREARAINRLHHPNIIAVHDFGRLPDGKFYLAMELANGRDLAKVIAREGRIGVPRALYILWQLASAVEHAHSHGVVHRDLKPENLFLVEQRGRPDFLKVVDFGIAKIFAPDYKDSLGSTPHGEVMGTPAYMAPEQLRGAGADPRSDLYAIGCLGFEILTGETPFFGRKMELMHAHLTQAPLAPSSRRPEAQIPSELDEVVLICMQKDPARRFQTARELVAALEAVPGFGTHPPSPSRRAAMASLEPDTAERRLPEARTGDERTAQLTPHELRTALRDVVRRLAEAMVDGGRHDLGLVIGAARAHQLDDDLRRHDAELARLERRGLEVEQLERDREAALRFALGELRFERDNRAMAGHPLDDEMEQQIADFEARLLAGGAELKQQLDEMMERSIAIAAARADVEEKLDEACRGLERLLDELTGSLEPADESTRSLASRFVQLRESVAPHGDDAVSDEMIGAVVAGRYQVLRLVGKGGMGSIYEVRHTKLKRNFALKKLAASLAGDSDALARFQREADVIASLRHPNIVEVVDWETLEDGSPCLIMEYLRGEDLDKRIASRGPLSWSAIARIGDAVMSALSVAHKAGIVHRDLKPQNIFLAVDDAGEEHVKLLDFGVSKIQSAKKAITEDQRLLGTPLYMSPEQADGRHDEVAAAADVWAMGAILYEMATAQAAFDAPSTPSVLYRICYGEIDPLAQHRPDAPPDFIALVAAACARDERRLRTIDQLRRGLREALAAHARFAEPLIADSASTVPVRLPREARAGEVTTLSSAVGQKNVRSRRARYSLGIGALATVILAGAGYLALRPPVASPPPKAPPQASPPVDATPKVTPLVAPAETSRAIVVHTRPANARLTLDGEPIEGPAIALPLDGRAHRLRATASGFADETLTLDTTTPDKVELILRRRATTSKPGPAPVEPAPRPATKPIVPLDP